MTKGQETLEEIKKGIAYCCYDGKSLGYYQPSFETIEKELKEKENIEYELGVYKLAFEWACNRIEGNPYYEILEEAKQNREAWKRINAGEKVGISDE